jgi:two-component system phosphate regulon response regulator PhoB
MSKGKILIVEDEAGFRRIYKEVLETDGYTVVLAETGEQGLKSANKESPDLILLDLRLPTMHGFEVLQKLKEKEATKNIPVIIFSVMGEQDDIQEGLDLGAEDYAVKGFYSPREILKQVGSILARTAKH